MFGTVSGMERSSAAEAIQTLEQGSITFFYRPRLEESPPDDLGDMQRILILLSPSGSPFERLIVVGRSRLPASARRERFWGFVDLVLTPYDMNAALGAQVYGTKTPDLRHLPAARPFGEGTYEVELHNSHSHLRWRVEQQRGRDPQLHVREELGEQDAPARDMEVEAEADYIVTVANPELAAWGLTAPPDLHADLFDDLELHVPLPTPFPATLQQRFRNGRFAQLDSIDWLDHPGAELVFAGAGD